MRIILVDSSDDWRSICRVVSTMLYPEDGQLQEGSASSLVWQRRLGALGNNQEAVLSKQDLESILGAPSLTELTRATARQAAIGQIAGELLILALQINDANRGASLRKARYLVSSRNDLINKRNESDNENQHKKLWASDSSLKKAWNQFRSVAHLWGALRLLASEKTDSFGTFSVNLDVPDILEELSTISLNRFASTSMWILGLATGIAPRHQTDANRSLLDADECWAFPLTIAAESGPHSLPVLPRWAGSLLRDYSRGPADS